MSHDTLLLIGRETARPTTAFETHARRLRDRGVADEVRLVRFGDEPRRAVDGVDVAGTDRVFALPMTVAHDHDTLSAVPAALDGLDADVHYCEPVGRSPPVTAALADRAAEAVPAGPETSVALVAAGSGGKPFQRQVTEYHAERLRTAFGFGEVVPCYLRQNPAVECVRYNLTRDHAVAVPLFLTRCAATADHVPAKLGLDRGGLAYADPLGTHEGVTDAVEAAVDTERALAGSPTPRTFEAALTSTSRRLATDGEGP